MTRRWCGSASGIERRRVEQVQALTEAGDVEHAPEVGEATAEAFGSAVAVRVILRWAAGEVHGPHRRRGERLGRTVDGIGEHGDGDALDGIEPRLGDEAGEPAAVTEHAPSAWLGDRQAQPVRRGGTLDGPLRALHLALAHRRTARASRRGSAPTPTAPDPSPSTRTRSPAPWPPWRCARSAADARRRRTRCTRWRGPRLTPGRCRAWSPRGRAARAAHR